MAVKISWYRWAESGNRARVPVDGKRRKVEKKEGFGGEEQSREGSREIEGFHRLSGTKPTVLWEIDHCWIREVEMYTHIFSQAFGKEGKTKISCAVGTWNLGHSLGRRISSARGHVAAAHFGWGPTNKVLRPTAPVVAYYRCLLSRLAEFIDMSQNCRSGCRDPRSFSR